MSLQQQQFAFTGYIRHPEQGSTIPDVARERMDVYRELFFNNILGTLENAFPVLKQVLEHGQWQALCERFFAEHRCLTPYLSHVPGEFVDFLEAAQVTEPPWLLELAQWEWSELELFLAEDEDLTATGDDPLQGVPVLSFLLRLHECRYPVHDMGDEGPVEPNPGEIYYLLAWRKRDNSVGFMQLNPLSHGMIRLMRDNHQYTGQQLLALMAEAHEEYDPALIINGGRELLQRFYADNIIIGSLEAPSEEPPYE